MDISEKIYQKLFMFLRHDLNNKKECKLLRFQVSFSLTDGSKIEIITGLVPVFYTE